MLSHKPGCEMSNYIIWQFMLLSRDTQGMSLTLTETQIDCQSHSIIMAYVTMQRIYWAAILNAWTHRHAPKLAAVDQLLCNIGLGSNGEFDDSKA